jgi:hypothetical protein
VIIHSNIKIKATLPPFSLSSRLILRQASNGAHTQQHHQQANRDNHIQHKAKPAQDHGSGADARVHAAVAEVLGDGGRRHRRRVLPQDRDEHEHARDEDERERDLADGPRGERLDVDLAARELVFFDVPAGEGGEQDEAEEGEDDGDDSV